MVAAPPSPRLVGALIGLLSLIWGSTWLVIREGLDDLPPFTSLGLRFLLSWAVFVAVARPLHRIEGGSPPSLLLTLTMGVCTFAISYGVVYWSELTVPSGLTSVLWGVFPIMMAVAGHFLLPGERLRPRSAVGFGLGFVGVVLLFVVDLRGISTEAMLAGAVLLTSPLISTVAQVVIKRHGGGTSSVLMCRNGLLVASVIVLPVALVLEHDAPMHFSGMALFSITYLAVMGTVLTFSLYFWLLRYASASTLSLIAYITPAVALLLGWLLRAEPLGPSTLVGAALIVLGVALAGRK